ncbi:peroxisomal coenzyme A diphosphatase NUDT7 isoform X1 [Syngnathus typhle]|uniref:peroxisomal coenzyme A diphosphatase NUDT7 isoform X1 n=1 Tax=Syngnathus typhle TaxID=161592 RepID=UPI002A6B5324|nr:peroxisomal coenzyme A diphosphatase NUDT7 isoform X1 [Syngnathus typhle]XP_061140260.1 peroxisomal coenzyme A diphosphatase NUDT7 isoform X1 [Syngnathus typhle]
MDVKETMAAFKPFDVRKQADILGEAELPQASVLVPLFMRSGKLHTLMTQRSEQLRVSAGEVCFPGGKRDSSDKDAVHTALREAHEEIGLPPGDVHVICTLQPFITKNSLLVTPVVGFIPESFLACPNTAEVSAVFTVPLDFFIRSVTAAKATSLSFDFVEPRTEVRYHIWGLTAMVAFIVATIALTSKAEGHATFDIEDLMCRLRQRSQQMRTPSKL